MGILTQEAKGVVQTTFEDLSDNPNRMPVGTTLALIEQGMVVFNAIHARLHDAMSRTLKILHRLNKSYMDEETVFNETGELMVKRADFNGPMDVIPVSDPNIFSEMQRFAQVQIIAERAAANPQLYDQRAVEQLILERTKIPDASKLLNPLPKPERLNAVNENVAACMNRAIIVFPDQDHLAHLKVHLDFLLNPMFGQNPIIQNIFTPTILTHIKDHMIMWYVAETVRIASNAAGMDVSKLMDVKNPEVDRAFDQMLAATSELVGQEAQSTFANLPPIIAQAMQVVQAMQKPPTDPADVAMVSAQAQAQDVARKAQADQVKNAIEQQKVQADLQAKIAELQNRLQINEEDNKTAMLISAAELQSGHNTHLKNGTGIGVGG